MIVSERVRRLAEGLFEYEDLGRARTERRQRSDACLSRHGRHRSGKPVRRGGPARPYPSGRTRQRGRDASRRLEKRAGRRRRTDRGSAWRSGHRQEPDCRHAARASRAGGEPDPAISGLPVFCQQRVLSDEDLVRANAGPQSRGGPRRAPRQARSADGRQARSPQGRFALRRRDALDSVPRPLRGHPDFAQARPRRHDANAGRGRARPGARRADTGAVRRRSLGRPVHSRRVRTDRR